MMAREVDQLAMQIEALMSTQQGLLDQLRNAKTMVAGVQQAYCDSSCKRSRRGCEDDFDRQQRMRSTDGESDDLLLEESSSVGPRYRGGFAESDEDEDPVYRCVDGLVPAILKSSCGPEDEFDDVDAEQKDVEDDAITYRSATALTLTATPTSQTTQLNLHELRKVVAAMTALAQQGAAAEEAAVLQQLRQVREMLG